MTDYLTKDIGNVIATNKISMIIIFDYIYIYISFGSVAYIKTWSRRGGLWNVWDQLQRLASHSRQLYLQSSGDWLSHPSRRYRWQLIAQRIERELDMWYLLGYPNKLTFARLKTDRFSSLYNLLTWRCYLKYCSIGSHPVSDKWSTNLRLVSIGQEWFVSLK